ncbi:MAG: hypothetical protein ACLPQS_12895 [Acidimicrobiales bacterium]
MAARGATARQTAPAAGRSRQGAAQPAKSARPALGVIDRRHVLDRARRRQARALCLLSGGILAGALTVAAAGHAMLAATQLHDDAVQSQLASATATEQNLLVQRAQLETPSRVLNLAEERFKMVAPTGVTYLQPVNPGMSVEQAHEAHSNATATPAARDHSTH